MHYIPIEEAPPSEVLARVAFRVAQIAWVKRGPLDFVPARAFLMRLGDKVEHAGFPAVGMQIRNYGWNEGNGMSMRDVRDNICLRAREFRRRMGGRYGTCR